VCAVKIDVEGANRIPKRIVQVRGRDEMENRVRRARSQEIRQRWIANVEIVGQRVELPILDCAKLSRGMKRSPSDKTRVPGDQQLSHDCVCAPYPRDSLSPDHAAK
jgi:hypothetical protein